MKTLNALACCVGFVGFGLSLVAADVAPTTNAAPAAAAINEADAGMLYTPVKGPRILVWDARTNASDRVINRFLKTNDPIKPTGPGLAVATELAPLAGDAYDAALNRIGADTSLVILVYNGGAKQPRMSVFPEDRVALVNSDRYSSVLLEKLLVREIWRAIGFVGGAGYAPYRGCVMQPVFSDAEIAALMGDVLQPMTLQPFSKFEKHFNMNRVRYVPYEFACYGGWAPQPTNEAQKVIWREVKEDLAREPTKPVRILHKNK